MKFSILTPTYNSEEFLPDTIHSLANQDTGNHTVEHIIIDGGSTDSSTEIVRARKSNCLKIISEPDRGIYDALNKGIRIAEGDVIGILHSDDLYADNYVISKAGKIFETYNADVVYADLVYVQRYNPDKIIRYWKSGHFSFSKLKFGWMPPHPSLFVRKDIYDKVGLFDCSYKISADYDIILRIFTNKNLKICYLPEILVKMRTGGISNRNLKSLYRKSREDYKALKKNKVGKWYTIFMKPLIKIPQYFNPQCP